MLHVLSVIIINLTLMITCFSTDNPLVVSACLLVCFIYLLLKKQYKKIKNGLLFIIPLALLTAIINVFTVRAGSIILFQIGNRIFTLEVFIYVIVMSLKMLSILYLFYVLDNMLDTDKALSYLSKKSPRITLLILFCLKLMPNMKKRIDSLKEVYMVRGINYNTSSKKELLKGYVPVLSILLEDSLERSFEIGESAYVRGFFSGKRSEYEKQKFKLYDYIIIVSQIIFLTLHLVWVFKEKITYDIYGSTSLYSFINGYSVFESIFILLIIIFVLYIERQVNKDVIYRN